MSKREALTRHWLLFPLKLELFERHCFIKEAVNQAVLKSAHWNQMQVAIYTEVAWTKHGTHSYCVVSNYLQQDKHATSFFINRIIADLQEKLLKLLELLTSFRTSQEFNLKFNSYCITLQPSSIQGSMPTGNFLATSYGKGAVVGVGSTVKQ